MSVMVSMVYDDVGGDRRRATRSMTGCDDGDDDGRPGSGQHGGRRAMRASMRRMYVVDGWRRTARARWRAVGDDDGQTGMTRCTVSEHGMTMMMVTDDPMS